MCTNQYSKPVQISMNQNLTELKRQMDKYKIIVGNLNISLSATDRTTRHKINKNREDLNNTINHQDLVDVDITLPTITVEYTFFQCSQNIHQDRP